MLTQTQHIPCPCGSGKQYHECCYPFHSGEHAPNALALMRSRYSAYALHLPQYIIKTTHPDNPAAQQDPAKWVKEILDFSYKTEFSKLEILDYTDGKTEAFVTFIAHLNQGNKEATFQEKSLFKRSNNQWLYHSGNVSRKKP